MCGIAGRLDHYRRASSEELSAVIARMTNTMVHRGPDDSGNWVDASVGVALGHRRLSIIDLTPEGHQPMYSHDGRFVIAYNGEIYNFLPLRRELESLGHEFRGHSDTEVMLAAITEWGLEPAVKRFVGMFAFALWDTETQVLYLARDRLGKKPLYYGLVDGVFFFGSELKALVADSSFRQPVDRGALALFMRHNCVPGPYSIYQGVRKLPAATILKVRAGEESLAEPHSYWCLLEVASQDSRRQGMNTAEAVQDLDHLLRLAVRQRMIADVPLGAFLSGGIDSSLVVALMQAQSDRPIRTFTIGFYEDEYNEADQARAVAEHLGTEHKELYVTPEEAISVIERLPTLYDEPFADSSQIPTVLVSEFARRYVTVALSGDGGDEVFAGYNRHFLGSSLWRQTRWMPGPIRGAVARFLRTRSPDAWESSARRLGPLLPKPLRQRQLGEKLYKAADVIDAESPESVYRRLVTHWKDPEGLILGAVEPPTMLTARRAWAGLSGVAERMMYLDTITYLPDDILVKVDRASMGVSLETRCPLLDHRVVEFAWSLPMSMKVHGGQGKWILRQVLDRYLPRALIERPKAGFGVPLDSWLRGPLKDWAEGLLDGRRLREEGFLDAVRVQEKWNEHLGGKKNWQYLLWDVLMFQLWNEKRLERTKLWNCPEVPREAPCVHQSDMAS